MSALTYFKRKFFQFPRHRLVCRDVPCDCHKRDDGYFCMFCEGGLSYCVTCGGAEGSLPSDCPGCEMEHVVEEAVYAGEVDYDARLGWVERDVVAEMSRRGTR